MNDPAPSICPRCGHSVKPQRETDTVVCWCGALKWDGSKPAPEWTSVQRGDPRIVPGFDPRKQEPQ